MEWYDILIRLALSVVIGFGIGFERERHHRPAGMKTHIMVCMGAAIVSMIQIHMMSDTLEIASNHENIASSLKSDYARLGAQVISGIGFLGAGTIIVRKGSVKGLTTAATLWLTACIGLAVGMGYYIIAAGGFLFAMLVLLSLRFLQTSSFRRRVVTLEIDFRDKKSGMDSIHEYCAQHGVSIKRIEFIDAGEGDAHYDVGVYSLQIPRTMEIPELQQDLLRENDIMRVMEITD